ncbi:unnamed protein product [Linum tenue]|uniref:Tim44-like domain-containing protein n=1 Tax=Linum tenue TaxID=586396 RepID=A0AAV0R9Z0_9ROSI|nr:unnamed protein product [Linum tenue]
MAARKLVRDLLLARQPLLVQRKPAEGLYTTSRLLVDSRWSGYRRFGVFNNVKEEVNRNPELQKSVKELKEKAGELKGVKDDLRVRTKQTTEKLYKHVDGVWTEAEATAKKVSSSVKEKISAATDEFKSRIPAFSSAFQKLKEAKVTEIMKKGYDIVKDELNGNPNARKHLEFTPFKGEISTKTDVVPMSSPKQSRLNEKWQAFRKKCPFCMDIWVGHYIHNITFSPCLSVGDTIFHETDAAASIKEIRRRDPSFSLPDFVSEVQDAIRPVLTAYMKGDTEALKKYCSPEVIARCEGERKAFTSNGIFFDNRLLHVSEVEVRETKMMGTSPIIIVAFQTQQIHCIRDRNDTIHTVYYAWAMQQVEPQELGEGAIYPIWRLREMHQLGVQALI